MISMLNILSFVALTLAVVLITVRLFKKPNKSLIALLFAVSLLSLSEFTNILEHLNLAPETDEWEDLLEIVFLPLLILSLHIGMLEEELNKRLISESKFEAIYNNAFTFIGLLDHEGRLLDANDASAKSLESNVTFMLGQYFWETPWWTHSETEQEKLKEAIKRVQNGEVCRFQTTHLNIDGEITHIDHSLTPVYDQSGELIYIIPEGRNITQLTLVLKELEQHKTDLEKLVDEKNEEQLSS